MKRFLLPFAGGCICLITAHLIYSPLVFSQGAGSAYSGNPYGYQGSNARPAISSLPLLDRSTAKEVISVEGAAEIKVAPDKIRLVFGVISESETAKECSARIKSVCHSTATDMSGIGIASTDVNQDFISVTPVFDWQETELGNEKAIKQFQTGYQMQSNFHVLCQDEDQAMQIIDIAFANGISDIIAFDYWSSKLDQAKIEARKLALNSAKAKAASMFESLEIQPRVVNVQEKTTVHKPAGLYRTFSNSNSTSVTVPRQWRDRMQVYAPRPKLTYLENLEAEKDIHTIKPAMRPEISVLSRVTTYYENAHRPPKPN